MTELMILRNIKKLLKQDDAKVELKMIIFASIQHIINQIITLE